MTIQLTEEQIAAIRVGDTAQSKPLKRASVDTPEKVVAYLGHLAELKREHVVLVTLDSRNKAIDKHVISIGTLDAALVHPREIYQPAILDNAAKIIVAHNHPSGSIEPSEDDDLITKRLIAAGKVVGIPLIDHIVIGREGYYSYQESGRI